MSEKAGLRIYPTNFYKSKEKYILYLKHLFAYEFARNFISVNSFVLDIGSGEGYGAYLLSQQAKKVVGFEVDVGAVDHASKKYSSNNLAFVLYNGMKIPFSDNYFHCVTCFQVIEHVADDELFVSEIFRVLKKGGILILTTPNRTYRLWSWQKPWNKYHVREYYPSELEELMKKYFPSIKILGIKGTEDVQRIEINRVKINKFDFLNLRRFVPIRIGRMLRKLLDGGGSNKMDYTVKDFYITEDTRQALDILAICRK